MPAATAGPVKFFLLLLAVNIRSRRTSDGDTDDIDGYNYYNFVDRHNDDDDDNNKRETPTTSEEGLLFAFDYDFGLFNDTSHSYFNGFNGCFYQDALDLDCLDHWLMTMNLSAGEDLSTPYADLLEALPLNFGALFLLPFPVLTVFGNVLVVMSVVKERSLQTVTNYFIVSLAVADIMVAIFVMPFAVYVEVNNSLWMLGDVPCDVWVALDVLCCTASILNLTAISVDRYFAVTQPIKYARHKNSKRVYLMLGLTWVISVAISSPIVLGANYTERRQQTKHLCTFYNSNFLIYSSMGSFYIPCIMMVLLYGKIFNAIRVRARKAAAQKKIKSFTAKSPPAQRIHGLKATFPAAVGGGATRGCRGGGQAGPAVEHHQCRVCVGGEVDGSNPEESRPCVVIDNKSAVEASMEATAVTVVQRLDAGCGSGGGSGGSGGGGGGGGCEPFNCSSSSGTTKISGANNSGTGSGAPKSLEQTKNALPRLHLEGTVLIISNESNNTCNCSTDLHGNNTNFLKLPPNAERRESSESVESACGAAIQPAHTDVDQVGSGPVKRDPRTSSDQEKPGNGRKKPDVGSTAHTFHFRFKKTKAKKALKNEKKLQSAQRRERKATKTLAIVLGVFLFCWVPFFTINIMNAICIRYDLTSGVCELDPILFSFFVWLGYMNSFINPVIYTIFNIEFRRAFKKLLRPIFKFSIA